ncbi:glycosyltransferase [Microbacterium aurantiacum]
MAVIVRYGLNATAWRARHERGEVADETPYAYHLAEPDLTLEWSVDRPEGRLAHSWRMFVRRVLGFDFVHVWRNRAIIARSDVVWTHTEREHLAVGALKALFPRRYRALTVAQSVWLWDMWAQMSAPRRALFARLLRAQDVEVVLSRVNRDTSSTALPGRRVVRVPFGTHFASQPDPGDDRPSGQTPARVLVIGNDRHRDWPLMARVARRLPDMDFDIISLSEEARGAHWPTNVAVRSIPQREILEHAYTEATVVALPLRPNLHASGCTVAIEAISAGLPVVATDTGGIDEYLEGSGAALVPVGDEDAFVSALASASRATARPDHSVASRRGLSGADYVARLALITHALLANEQIPPDVERFEPPASRAGSPVGQVSR